MYGPTDRDIDRQTDKIYRYHVYVGLAQAHPYKYSLILCNGYVMAIITYAIFYEPE